MTKKILFISEGYGIGGTTRVMSRLSDIFTKNGLEVDILVPNYRHYEIPTLPAHDNLYYISKDDQRKNRISMAIDLLFFLIKFVRITQKNQYDYVISFWNYINLLLVLIPLNNFTPKIICSHISFSSLKPHWKILTRMIYPHADSVIVLNEREAEIFSKFCDNVTIIENPLPDLSAL